MASRIEDNLYVQGTLNATTTILSDGCVDDDKVASDADIDSTKLMHRHAKTYGQNGTMSAVTLALHVAQAAGTVKQFRAGSVTLCTGDAAATVDLKKNGTTVLSGVITLDAANTAYVVEAGSISSASYVANDVFTVVITVNAGTGSLGTGILADAVFDEAAT